MAAKDIFHQQVRRALEKDGWTVTTDPFVVFWPKTDKLLHPDGERLLGATKDGAAIAVIVTSFLGASQITDLQYALGQFVVCRSSLRANDPARSLFLAIREDVSLALFEEPEMKELCSKEQIRLLVFNSLREKIVKWQ